MFEYICEDCHVEELYFEVMPKKTCPCCGILLEVIEWEGVP